VLSLISIGESI